ncbi:hypothetical protein EDI_171290 [Entamoeba dispar SAW760]|uniref:EF-hand domain-containing protein n=1 Tax=Entamoeba dispar (strain ATCC PRA-260 / SAW760) TaxID=370354 RepID=B0EFC6_ENTDS|nr:uncharacterized protein EDI_171290 [Entamoeba dispar SAW760]EDR26774.1 hypothetical protein EDI_171290 [Entamoeba dispar SAW760]|eukprot:EDR26774.1 hypothetical protein EDI_171290 [Entamoeba dispar SAW760]
MKLVRRNTQDKRQEELPTQSKKQQKKEEEERLLNLFDKYDTEGRGELDSYQISHYLEKKHNLTLPDFIVKQLISEKVMSITSTKIQRKDFIGFNTIIDAKMEELNQNKISDNKYQECFAQLRKNDPKHYKDFLPHLVPSNRKPRTIVEPPIFENGLVTDEIKEKKTLDPKRKITSQEAIAQQIFYPPMNIVPPSKLHFVSMDLDDQTRKLIDLINKGNDEIAQVNISLKSTVAGENEGTRRKQWPTLLKNYSDVTLEDTLEVMLGNDDEAITNAKLKRNFYTVLIHNFRLECPIKEKFHCVFAIYTKNKLIEKVTSDFHFDPSGNHTPIAIEINSTVAGDKDNSLWAILFVYRNADAKQNTMRDIYCGEELPKGKKLEALKQNINIINHRSLIGIGAVKLPIEIKEKKGPIIKPLTEFKLKIYRDDEFKDVLKLINDIDSGKEPKATQMSWALKIDRLREAFSNGKGGSAQRMDEFNIIDANGNELTDQISDAPKLYLLEDVSYPFVASTALTEYSMNYYLYPKDLVFKEKRKTCLYLEFVMKTNETEENENNCVECFYGDNVTGGFCKKRETAVKGSNKSIKFNDEIKIKMPKQKEVFDSNSNWHILIKVMEMQLDGSKVECRSYGVLRPILPQTTEVTIDLIKPSNEYLSKPGDSRGTLKIKVVNLVSLVPTMKEIQVLGETVGADNVMNIIEKIGKISFGSQNSFLRMYFPTVLNWMIGGVVGQNKFMNFVIFFHSVLQPNNEIKEHSLLEYINDFFDPQTFLKFYSHYKYVFLLILGDFVGLMNDNEVQFNPMVIVKYSWFFFDLIIRSLVYYLNDEINKGNLPESIYGSAVGLRFEKSVIELVQTYLRQLMKLKNGFERIKANLFLANFIRDLMRFWKLTYVVGLIDMVMDWYAFGGKMDIIGTQKLERGNNEEIATQVLRVDFLNVLRDSSILFRANSVESKETFEELCFAQQTILSLMIRNYMMLIIRGGMLQRLGVFGLSLLVMRFDCDSSIQSQENKEKLATMMMPIVIYMIEEYDFFKKWHSINLETLEDKHLLFTLQSFVLCFMFVMKNLKTSTLRTYLEKEVPIRCSMLMTQIEWALKVISIPIPTYLTPIEAFRETRRQVLINFFDMPQNANEVFFTMERSTKIGTFPVEQVSRSQTMKLNQKPLSKNTLSGGAPKRPSFISFGKTIKDTFVGSSSSSSSSSKRGDSKTIIGNKKDEPDSSAVGESAGGGGDKKSIKTDIFRRAISPRLFGEEDKKDSSIPLFGEKKILSPRKIIKDKKPEVDQITRKMELQVVMKDCLLTIMDVIEIVYDIFIEKEKINENEINSKIEAILKILIENSSMSTDICSYLRDFIVRFRVSLFTRSIEISLNIVKQLLEYFYSKENRKRLDAITLMYLFTKCNYITTYDAALSESHISSALVSKSLSSTAQNQLIQFSTFLSGLDEMKQIHEEDREWAQKEMETAMEKSYNEIHNDNNAAVRVQQLCIGLDAAAIEEFISYLCELIKPKLNQIKEFEHLDCSYIDCYNEIRKDVSKMYFQNLRFKEEDSIAIQRLIKSRYTGTNLYEPLYTSYQKLDEMFIEFMNNYRRCLKESRKQQEKEEKIGVQVQKYEEVNEKIFDWVRQELKVKNVFGDGIGDVDLLEKKESLTVKLNSITKEGNELLNEACDIENELRKITDKKEVDSLICVESNDLKQLIQDVVAMVESQLQGIIDVLDVRQNYQERKAEIDKIIAENEKLVCQQHAAIMNEFCEGPVSAEYFTRRFVELQILNEQSIELCRRRGEKSGEIITATAPWETYYNYWERIIQMSQNLVVHLKNCVLKKKTFDENFNKAREWYQKENSFAKNVLKVQEFYLSSKATLKLELPESHEFFETVVGVTEGLIKEENEIKGLIETINKETNELDKILKTKEERKEKRRRKSSVEMNKRKTKEGNNTEKVFGFIERETPYTYEILGEINEIGEEFMKKLEGFDKEMKVKKEKEKEREQERNNYKNSIEEFYRDCNESLKAVKVDFKTLKNARSNYSKIQEIIKKRISWINKYVNYEGKEMSLNEIWNKTNEKGLVNKENKVDEKKEELLKKEKTKKVGTIKITKKKKEVFQFLDCNGKFRREALLDVSPMQQREFHREFENMIEGIKDLCNRLTQLLESHERKTEPEEIHEKVYSLAIEAIGSPQLHFTWMCELSHKLKIAELNIEEGLCEVAIVYYLFNSLYGDNVVGNYEEMLTNIAPDFLLYEPSKISNGMVSAFTNDKLIHHALMAVEAFEEGKLFSHAVQVCEFLLAHFQNMNDLNQIVSIHSRIEKLYEQMGAVGKGIELHYYCVIISNSSNGTNDNEYIYCSTKTRSAFEQYIHLVNRNVGITVWEVYPIVNNQVIRQQQAILIPTDKFMLENDQIKTSIEDSISIHVEYQTERKLPSLLSRSHVISKFTNVLSPCEKTVGDMFKLYEALESVFDSGFREDIIPILRYILAPTPYSGLLTTTQVFLDKTLINQDKALIKELFDIVCKLSNLCKMVLDEFEDNTSKEIAIARKDYFNFAMFIKSIEETVLNFIETPNEEN